MEITYSKYRDYYLPDLAVSQKEPATYGRFGRIRLKYLKEHCRVTYINLKTSGKLTHHLNEIDREANVMLHAGRILSRTPQALEQPPPPCWDLQK